MLLLVLVLPAAVLLLVFGAIGKPRHEPAGPYVASLVYFACLGFGFISVELALLQHLTLLLGHPSFTLSVLLFTLLASGGIGAAISRRVPVALACAIAALLTLAGALLLPSLVPMLLPLALGVRVGIAIAAIAPLGLAMGMPFPRGLQRVGEGPFPAAPFYWGLNGITSVIGSVATVMIALNFGFTAAMLAGASCYIVAAITAPLLERDARSEPVPADDVECDTPAFPESAV